MSKMFNCWFWKKKCKNKEEQQTNLQNNPETILNDMYDDYNQSKDQNCSQTYQRCSVSFAKDPVYIDNRIIKSYPMSPDRASHRDKRYLSDQRVQLVDGEGRRVPYRRGSATVLVAALPQLAPYLKSNHKESTEFPYQIPDSPAPRRSSLLYGVKCKESGPEKSETPRYMAEKPMEDYDLPSTSEVKQHSESDEYDNSFNVDEDNKYNSSQDEAPKNTVIRFRPGSTGSAKPPSDFVKVMTFRADTTSSQLPTLGKYVHQLPLRANKQSTVLKTADGRLLQPIESDKVRSAFRSHRDSQEMRVSVDESSFPIKQRKEPVVYAAPVISTRRTSLCQPISRQPAGERRRYSVSNEEQEQSLPFDQADDKPVVYAVATPTRGRRGSILQHSVKTLISKEDQPSVHRKNIRYSVDTDVFSTETRRRSVKQSSPRYVNMEKGQPLLVSDVLNPITSLFVSDLKDHIPKDPLTKPKETNVWVKPRRYSEQRQLPKQPVKSSPRVIYFEDIIPKALFTPDKRSPNKSNSSRYDSSSSSEQERDKVHRSKAKQYVQRKQHHVYAAEMPEITLTDPNEGKTPPLKKKGKHLQISPDYSLNRDICGLNCNASEEVMEFHTEQGPTQSNDKIVSPTKQSDEEEEIDLLCYPSEKFLRTSALAAESGSKLRWRIIIKRGDDK